VGLRRVMENFEQIKGRLKEAFGHKFTSFLKSIFSIFQLLSGIDEKLVKSVAGKLGAIQKCVADENRLLKLFSDELKANVEKFMVKSALRKDKESSDGNPNGYQKILEGGYK
jgi:hypothetical protein